MSTRSKTRKPVQVVKKRRDAALRATGGRVPYINFLGIQFDRRGKGRADRHSCPISDKRIATRCCRHCTVAMGTIGVVSRVTVDHYG